MARPKEKPDHQRYTEEVLALLAAGTVIAAYRLATDKELRQTYTEKVAGVTRRLRQRLKR